MDFITAYLFGIKNASNFLDHEKFRRHWLRLYGISTAHSFFPQELPRLTKFLKWLHIDIIPARVNDAKKELEDWALNCCDATYQHIKRSAGAGNSDTADHPVVFEALLGSIRAEDERNKPTTSMSISSLNYPRLSIASEVIDHLLAGHETTGIILTNLSWHLSQRPSLQEALRAELLTLSPNMRLSSATCTVRHIPPPRDLDALPLLHAILMETLRHRAAIPGGQPRITPFPFCTLGSYRVPGNVRIGAQAHVIHHNASVYPEPDVWDYTRWLDPQNGYTEEERRERDRWFWAFGSGSRMCIGKNFAIHGKSIEPIYLCHVAEPPGIPRLLTR
ncbi:hypothetical protein K3495_g12076 [Podosphaera aphanis]|nr:hypothetical protein K3495_g12076 [Podosphaera aphanis]